MNHKVASNPWEKLEELLESGDAQGLKDFLGSLPIGETARALSRLREEDQSKLLTWLDPEEAADLIEQLSDAQAVDLIEDLPARQAAAIIDEMRSDQQADLLGELTASEAEAIIENMAPEEAIDVRLLLQYPPDTAGGMMITEFLAYPDHLRVEEILADLRRRREDYSDYDVQYAYVTTSDGRLTGVLRLRDLLLSSPESPTRAIMIAAPLWVTLNTSLNELVEFFNEHRFFGVPVVDDRRCLVGVVRRTSVDEAVGNLANKNFLKVSGFMGAEELRSMPLLRRSSRRLSWLSINIVLNVIAASVIAMYQDTLAAAITLAVFLPIISDMSGCSGNQAVAVSIRELALGLVKPYELFRVLFKEAAVGLINGCCLAILLAATAFAWQGNAHLGLVVGSALMLNTLVSVSLGGVIPLALKGINLDPALASGPILTTITDMCGFFFVLSFATAVLPKLAAT